MTHDVSPEQLKALRLAAGLELAVLARQVSLSTAQLMQLESGTGHLFYTPAIQRQAARKVYFRLTGRWPVNSGLAALPKDQTDHGFDQENADPQAHPTAPPEVAEPALAAQPTRGRPWIASTVTRPGFIGMAMLAGLGWAAWMMAARSMVPAPAAPHHVVADSSVDLAQRGAPPPVRQGAPSGGPLVLNEPSANASSDPEQDWVALSPTSALPADFALRAQTAPDFKCGNATEPVVSLALPTAQAAQVRLVSAVRQTVCVTDGSGLSSQHRLSPGQSASVAGAPPWLIQAGSLRQVQIDAQGVKLDWPAEMKNQVRLLAPP